MPSFRWPELANDIALATEAMSLRPVKPHEWDTIAVTLSRLFSTDDKVIVLKGRGCREHLDLLVKKLKQENSKSLKKKYIGIRV